ncbi:MAG: hypothetical protein L0191_14675 [Acidobacteria bacterium]|nr:hypothetical protein [Acidobacteriota bacterium]MCI0566624.1 hypothetical protein [Acidobacteriota bacterium]
MAAPLEIWARWDSEWYLLIAGQGYELGDQLRNYSVGNHAEDAAGFFPLYRALLGASQHLGLPAVLSGVLISNAALLVALTLTC